MNERGASGLLSNRPRFPQRASTLVLVPTMMLVFIALGSIAVDLSAMHLAHRRTHSVISAAADDAAGMLDEHRIQVDGFIGIDPDAARRVALARIAAARLPGEILGEPTVTVSPDRRSLTVGVKLRTEHIFLKTMPGMGTDVLNVHSAARLND